MARLFGVGRPPFGGGRPGFGGPRPGGPGRPGAPVTPINDGKGPIKKAFKAQIGTKDYNIEMEDGENVIIERSMGAKDYSLVLVSSSVEGVTVKVHRD